MELENYLRQHHTQGTAKRYLREINLFFLSFENKSTTPEDADYQQVMQYIGSLRNEDKDPKVALFALKKYYDWLIHQGVRKDHPAKSVKLRDNKSRDIQMQELFNTEELALLLDREERYVLLRNRNKIIISFLIWQALTNGDIRSLQLQDINLEKGTIDIRSTPKSNARTLRLRPEQVFWLMNYIQQDRPQLTKDDSQALIISKLGKEENGEGIGYLIETMRPLFPDRTLNPKTIRQSVIANLLKDGKDIRHVQTFAGHKYPSTTERYKHSQTDKLKEEILKKHPLG
ncbi:tyrosine-type recombinase/integrase [Aureibacter tunicatorum]|uniref:Integrase/recombinase XerD n=1 Tax=Aureibacter tunicatorum TaxID=866807 RepID=A0AAE3XT37_9BACT|nr:tyrosine-type recombinase/integrase [Aureibacter tunicatorum]MDR6242092.1 integrase/recombinase XerD [Aureibacter tunicatorum]